MPSALPPLHELLPILQDHPSARVVLWHLDGLKQEGMAPELWLTTRELTAVDAFSHERRRREWTAARIALKHLLLTAGEIASPLDAEIRKNERGQPYVVVYAPATGHYREFNCSLAHKNHLVIAVLADRNVRVGVDIERRSWRLSHLRGRFESVRDRLLPGHEPVACHTLLWAFKEATSKLLGSGFACGFSQIVCRETRYGVCDIEAPDGLSFSGYYGWTERYAIALVTDAPSTGDTPPRFADVVVRPWYAQLARARRVRRLRRTRAVEQLTHQLNAEKPDAD